MSRGDWLNYWKIEGTHADDRHVEAGVYHIDDYQFFYCNL